MRSGLYISFLFIIFYGMNSAFGQILKHNRGGDTTDITFSGTRINPYDQEYDSTGKVQFTGYIDTYYAYYTDTTNQNGYCKFPTIAPRQDQIGINILQISAKYLSNQFRGTITLFGGDCPRSSWSEHLNYVQEANLGFRIVRKLWLDAGFFRTHIGLESIQPRENMAISLATTTYFEPYFLSGVKLTWQQSKKLAVQLNGFNSFNQFLETNKNKAFGLSVAYSPTTKLNATFSSIVCDESPKTATVSHLRVYNNLCVIYKSTRWVLGLEGNFGTQSHTMLSDTNRTAVIWSAMLAAKYRFTPKWSCYVRGESFSDPNEILTGPVFNNDHKLVGLDLSGVTAGLEFKPIPNSYLRFESRYLETHSSESIFYYKGSSNNYRVEFITALGLWF